MASPTKPWERAGVNQQSVELPVNNFMSSGPLTGSNVTSSFPMSGVLPCSQGGGDSPPPPVPNRPTTVSTYSPGMGYGNTGSLYSGGMYSSPYSYGGYGGHGGYGGYGGYGYSRFGAGNNYSMDSFSRQAEESTRPAFQSIESIVYAFSSVSMMLDSTFQAVYNSFRAVIGVADNFTRMRMQFAQIFSAFAIFRTIRYLYRKLLVFLRLRPHGFAEEVWADVAETVTIDAALPGANGPKKSAWPVVLFFAMVMGGPWLIWKVIGAACSKNIGWACGDEDHFEAQALYDFKGNSSDELSFSRGQKINVAPKELQPRMKGWLLASVDGKTVGIIPANYVKVLGKKRGGKYQSQIDPQNSATSQQPWSQKQGEVVAPQLSSSSPTTSEVKTPVSSKSSPDLDIIFRSSGGNNDAANMEAVDILDKSTS